MEYTVLCDFDGTITEIDTAEFILNKFAKGDWRAFEKQFENGKITLEECLRKQFSTVEGSKKEILDALEDTVSFRPDFGKLARYCRKSLIPVVIVSAGLDFVIEHYLALKGWTDLVSTYTPETKFSHHSIELAFPKLHDKKASNFKQDLVRQYKNIGRKVFYIGDGSGDYAAMKDADYPFAIRGSKLAKLCKNNGIQCIEINDFQEVINEIRKIRI